MPRRTDLYTSWERRLKEQEIFSPGDRVGVAVSGGADSSLLLEFMCQLGAAFPLVLSVVHFNHHLRGADSNADEEFVRGLAARHGLEFHLGQAQVADVARQQNRNVEAVARELRYGFFFSLVDAGKLDRVATAHTADDQAETVLLRLLRGVGTRGLGGIYPSLEGKIVRPFLNVTRAEIERELVARGLEWRLDSSNRDLRFRRNRIRHELLPQLKREYNPNLVQVLCDLADRARDDEFYLEEQARLLSRPWRSAVGKREVIPADALVELPAAIQRRALRQMLQTVRGNLRGISYRHIEDLRKFAAGARSGHQLVLPSGCVAEKDFRALIIHLRHAEPARGGFSYPVTIPGQVVVPELGLSYSFEITGLTQSREKGYNKNEVAALDRGKLTGRLVLRSWRPGDRFQLPGRKSPAKLKELFRELRIPSERRRWWPVLAGDSEVIWVRGFPPSASVVVAPETEQVVVITESGLAAPAPEGEKR